MIAVWDAYNIYIWATCLFIYLFLFMYMYAFLHICNYTYVYIYVRIWKINKYDLGFNFTSMLNVYIGESSHMFVSQLFSGLWMILMLPDGIDKYVHTYIYIYVHI